MKIAVYPGSFDPITNGHLDILKRALKVFDKVILLVAVNPQKKSRFSPLERLEMIKESVKDMKNVEVDLTDGLTVDYASKHNANHLIRGLRAVTDFEYEFQLAAANEFANSAIDIVFFMSRGGNYFINSSLVIQLFENGVDIAPLVPKPVLKALKKAK
ncbi:MAG: pantetheine-phosphate adenylyltransferase [Erysipelotrichia bacterium]|jgi:pantetheine-phosphate adenylyltransferase|nr:pantetheine-phosphate adenylyltransferase [Bacilli bacterium]NLB49255.1 pantetheine-phosphate adenylyltransferase [Erysipelotrichia bacterium]